MWLTSPKTPFLIAWGFLLPQITLPSCHTNSEPTKTPIILINFITLTQQIRYKVYQKK